MRQLRIEDTRLLDLLPERLRPLCTPEAILRSVYGVAAGEWTCPACGTAYELRRYPSPRCECGRPLPRRCTSSGCETLCQPRRDGEEGWLEPEAECAECRRNATRKHRSGVIRRVFPSHLLACCRDYLDHAHRGELDQALQRWVDSDCGRAEGYRPWVVAWGDTGSGKSVALVYHAVAAYWSRGLVRTVHYATEEELLRAASTEWVRDEASKAPLYPEARELLDWCEKAELLVLDEVGTTRESALTNAQERTYKRLLKLRLDNRQPTLVATNRDPVWDGKRHTVLAWLDKRADSRLAELGWVVRCSDVDLRRAA